MATRRKTTTRRPRVQAGTKDSSNDEPLLPLRTLIQEHVQKALTAADGNKAQACSLLGISVYQLRQIRLALRHDREPKTFLFYANQ